MKKILLLDSEDINILTTLVRVSSINCKDSVYKSKLVRLLKKLRKDNKK